MYKNRCNSFWETLLLLEGFFTVIDIFTLHKYQMASKYNKDDKSNYHQQY